MGHDIVTVAVGVGLSALIGILAFIFKQHTKQDDAMATSLVSHLNACGEKSLQVAKMLARLEESLEAKHEELRNTNAALNAQIVRLQDRVENQNRELSILVGRQLEKDKIKNG